MDEKARLLAELRDVHVPDASLWPAPGWWWLALFVAVVIGALLYWRRHHLRNRWRREAQQELAEIRSVLTVVPVDDTLSRVSRLVRRVLLAVAPADQVAGLQGPALLGALDELCRQPLFTQGAGQLLEHGPYQRSPCATPSDLGDLCEAIAVLIRQVRRG